MVLQQKLRLGKTLVLCKLMEKYIVPNTDDQKLLTSLFLTVSSCYVIWLH